AHQRRAASSSRSASSCFLFRAVLRRQIGLPSRHSSGAAATQRAAPLAHCVLPQLAQSTSSWSTRGFWRLVAAAMISAPGSQAPWWLWLRESETDVKFIDAGAALFA